MPVTVTEAAAKHVTKYLARRGKGVGVRLGVKTTGCSGLAYKLEYADEVAPEDVPERSLGGFGPHDANAARAVGEIKVKKSIPLNCIASPAVSAVGTHEIVRRRYPADLAPRTKIFSSKDQPIPGNPGPVVRVGVVAGVQIDFVLRNQSVRV